MASKTQIANLSLLRQGITKRIANVDTEQSKEALAIKVAFDDEVDYVLRDFPWPWAKQYATGQLVSGSSTTPANSDWVFAYRYPSNCLMVRRVVTSAGRKATTRPPFEIGRDDQGRLIFTDTEAAEFEYTARITNPEEFDALFISMLAWKIASVTAPALSRIDEKAKEALQMYEIEKTKAQARALNESQKDPDPESEWIAGR